MADRAVGKDRHIGGAGADIDHGHAKFALVLCEHRQAGGQRVEHELVHFQAATPHALDDVLGRALRASDDMHFGLKPDTAHANGFANILPVNHKLLRLHQQQALVG